MNHGKKLRRFRGSSGRKLALRRYVQYWDHLRRANA